MEEKINISISALESLRGIIKYCKDMQGNKHFEPLDRLVYMDVPFNRGLEEIDEALSKIRQ